MKMAVLMAQKLLDKRDSAEYQYLLKHRPADPKLVSASQILPTEESIAAKHSVISLKKKYFETIIL